MKHYEIRTEGYRTGSGRTVGGIAAVFDAVLEALNEGEQITIKEVRLEDVSNAGDPARSARVL